MEAFISGAISALNRTIKAIEILDAESNNELLNTLKEQLELYKQLYASYRNIKNEQNIPNDIGLKLDETCKEIAEDIKEARKEYDA